MPGCSLKEAFPGFIKDVNENPGYGVFQPNTTIDSGGPTEHDDNIGQFERVIPENIEKLLEDSTYGIFPDENKYLFDRIPQESLVETNTSKGHLTEDIIRHVKKCSSCRKTLMLSTTVIRENIRPMDQMIELSTFLATGIFIILILDIMTKSQR
jgi:hypothetical protein